MSLRFFIVFALVVCPSALAGPPKPPCWNLKSCKASCEKADPWGCRLLAQRYQLGLGQIPVSLPKAVAAFEKACGLGDLASCTTLATFYFEGRPGLERNAAKAVELHEQSCTKGQLDSCVTLGHLYLTGSSVPKDLERAQRHYEQACRGGARAGCDSLALVGVTREDQSANAHLKEECGAGKAWACNVLRQLGTAAR